MAVKIGRGKSNRRVIATVSNEELIALSQKNDRGTDAQKARVELTKRGVTID